MLKNNYFLKLTLFRIACGILFHIPNTHAATVPYLTPVNADTHFLASANGRTCIATPTQVTCMGDNSMHWSKTISGFVGIRQISMGENNLCVLDQLGLSCYGSNEYRQLEIPRLEHPFQVAVAASSICALDDFGVSCWGDDAFDLNRTLHFSQPTLISIADNFRCVLEDKGVNCVRSVYAFELDSMTPPVDLGRPTQMISSKNHTCALLSNEVKCWGKGREPRAAPIPPLLHPHQIAVADDGSCALDDEGVKCWGHFDQSVPQLIPMEDLQNPLQLTVANDHLCVLETKDLRCWGKNELHQSGPQLPPKNPTNMKVNLYNTCAIDRGKWNCWGNNFANLTDLPQDLPLTSTITMSDTNACALNEGKVICWGSRKSKIEKNLRSVGPIQKIALGIDTGAALFGNTVRLWKSSSSFSRDHSSPTFTAAIDLKASRDRICVLEPTQVECWDTIVNAPRTLGLKLDKAIQIAVGQFYTCALDANGVSCDEDSKNKIGILPVPAFHHPRQLVGGENFACVLDDDGVKCWGRNENHQLDALKIKNARELGAGAYHACALGDDGLQCWGYDRFGQVSLGK